MPALEEEDLDSPEEYFDKITNLLKRIPVLTENKWKVLRQIRLGFFTNSKDVMYRDLDVSLWKDNSLLNNENVSTALIGKESSESELLDNGIHDSEVETCHKENSIPAVLDADSSQMKVMIRIDKGENLVVQGPPGTGKSQTIANMIATAINSGKKVLFVAEKLAALNVVASRLEKVGLSCFCLELHSNKLSPKSVLGQVKSRLALSKNYEIPSQHGHLKRLNRVRDDLYNNCKTMKQVIPELGITVHDVIWLADSTKCKLENYCNEKVIVLPKISDSDMIITKDNLLDIHHKFDTLHLLWKEGMPHKAKFWNGFILDKRIRHSDVSIIEKILARANNELSELIKFKNLNQHIPLFRKASLTDIRSWHKGTKELNIPPAKYISRIGENLAKNKFCLKDFEEFSGNIAKYIGFKGTDAEVVGKRLEVSESSINIAINSISSVIEDFPLATNYTTDEICKIGQDINDSGELINQLSNDYKTLSKYIDPELSEFNLAVIKRHLIMLEYILELDIDIVESISPVFFTANVTRYYDKAEAEFNELAQERNRLSQMYHISEAPEISDLEELKNNLKIVRESIFSWLPFGKNAKIKRNARFFCVSGVDVLSDSFINNLSKISILLDKEKEFLNSSIYHDSLSILFKGIDTDWSLLSKCIQVAHKIKTDYPQEKIYKNIMDSIPIMWEEYDTVIKTVTSCSLIINQVIDLQPKHPKLSISEIVHYPLDQLQSIFAEISNFLEINNELIQNVSVGINIVLAELKKVLESSLQWRSCNNSILAILKKTEHLGVSWIEPEDCSLDDINESLSWIKKIYCFLPKEQVSWSLVEHTAKKFNEYTALLNKCSEHISMHMSEIYNIEIYGKITDEFAISPNNSEASLDDRYIQISKTIECCEHLIAWSDYQFTLNWFKRDNSDLLNFALDNNLDGESLQLIVNASYYKKWVEVVFERFPHMWDFSRAEHEVSVDHFRQFDKELFSLNQDIINRTIAKNSAVNSVKVLGNRTGRVGTYTGMGLLNNELQKRSRHVPVRALVKHSGKALQCLMPCWMMSPSSVAQFLPPEEIDFDILIMDEASQIRPEDAIGALTRTQQAVIVGDSNQMPPTNMFSSKLNDEDPDESYGADDMKSILDRLSSNFKEEWLRWHYRSHCQDLIMFSNDKYYSNELIIPPAAFYTSDEVGIKFEYCPNTKYHKGVNEIEAELIVNFVKKHVIKNSSLPQEKQESLGIVALNKKQAAVIDEAIDNMKLKCKEFEIAYRSFFHEEPLFVRNLENVQGDERDVIVIGVTYGPDINTGRIHQRFGPINSTGGWRRLNVLFTRSRKRIHLFTSMKSSDIILPQMREGERSGRADLKAYLEFAETGALPDYGVRVGDNTESPFEDSVLHELRKAGFEAHPQIGVEGFRVDIGVIDPNNSGRYLCGIECDGATYHSSLVARDRDRLRQEILEARGWNIFRIWSNDWFKCRDNEIKRMTSHLNKLENDSKYIKV